MEILLISLTFLVLLLLVVWRPFFRQAKKNKREEKAVVNNSQLRHETNIGLYREHKKEIEKDYSEGGIDEENYQYLIAELDNTLLQDIDAGKKGERLTTGKTKHFSPFWPLGLSVFVIVFSVALYNKQGSYQQITQMPVGHDQHQGMAEQSQRENEAITHIKKLQKFIEENPKDVEAWYNLGQTYVAVGAFDAAIGAFKQVINIEGEKADLLGAIAQALYYKNNQQLSDEIQQYIDKALALDANDPSTNILLGMHNFIGENYSKAIAYWQRVIDANNQGVNVDALKEAVAEANYRLNAAGNPSTPPNTSVASTENSTSSQQAAGPQLSVSVSVDGDIAKQLAQGPDRVVFIYAVPTNGQRMPLAAVKLKLSNLPAVVVLNNSQAMSPSNNLGSVEKAHVYAVVSKLGGVGIKPGDYKAEALNVDVNSTDTLNLVVDSLVE